MSDNDKFTPLDRLLRLRQVYEDKVTTAILAAFDKLLIKEIEDLIRPAAVAALSADQLEEKKREQMDRNALNFTNFDALNIANYVERIGGVHLLTIPGVAMQIRLVPARLDREGLVFNQKIIDLFVQIAEAHGWKLTSIGVPERYMKQYKDKSGKNSVKIELETPGGDRET